MLFLLKTQIMCNRSMSVLLSPSSSSANFKFHIYLLILLTGVQLIDAFCDEHQWWQEQLGQCIPCTVCDKSESIVLRPCQPHSDTVCGTLDDVEVELDWLKAAAVAAEHKQVSYFQRFQFLFLQHIFFNFLFRWTQFDCRWIFIELWKDEFHFMFLVLYCQQSENHQHLGVIEKATSTMLMWDWQSLSLALAGLMCLLFFIVAACIYWQHSHYWKKLEQMEKRYNAGKRETVDSVSSFYSFDVTEVQIKIQKHWKKKIINERHSSSSHRIRSHSQVDGL